MNVPRERLLEEVECRTVGMSVSDLCLEQECRTDLGVVPTAVQAFTMECPSLEQTSVGVSSEASDREY